MQSRFAFCALWGGLRTFCFSNTTPLLAGKSAYNFYMQAAMKDNNYLKLAPADRLKAIGESWREMPAQQKKKWEEYASKQSGTKRTTTAAAATAKPKPATAKAPKGKARVVVKTVYVEKKKPKAISGRQMFTSEMYKTKEILDLPFEKRFSHIANLWKQRSEEEKKVYDEKAALVSPKKAASGYQLFMRDLFKTKEVQESPFEKRLQYIAKAWKAQTAEQIDKYNAKAAELKAQVQAQQAVQVPPKKARKTSKKAPESAAPTDKVEEKPTPPAETPATTAAPADAQGKPDDKP